MLHLLLTKNTKKRSAYYNRLLITLILIISLTIASLSLILYFNFQKFFIVQVQNYIKDSLLQISYGIDVMEERAKTAALQIYFDVDVSRVIHLKEIPYSQKTKATQKLDLYKSVDPFIHSIYVCNLKDDVIYSTDHPNTFTCVSKFPDKQIIDILKNKKFEKLVPITRSIKNLELGKYYKNIDNIFSFIFFESSGNIPGELDNAIVINVSGIWLENTVRDLSQNTDDILAIVNSSGKYIIDNSIIDKNSYKNFSNQVTPLLNSESGYFLENIDDTKYLVTYISDNNLGWKLVRLTNFKKSMYKMNKIKRNILIVSIVMGVFGLLLSLNLSTKLYKPFNKITNKVKLLESEKKNNLNDYKQSFFRNLLTNGLIENAETLNNKLSYFNMKINFDSTYVMVVFRINRYSELCNRYNVNDKNALKFAIINVARELFDDYYTNDAINLTEKHIVLMFNTETPLLLSKDKLANIIESIHFNVQKHLGISLSSCISMEADSLLDLNEVFHECLQASNNAIFHEENCILFTRDIITDNKKDYTYPKAVEKSLVEAFRMGNMTDINGICNEIINECKDLTFNVFYNTMLLLLSTLNETISDFEKNYGITVSHNFNRLITDMYNYDSIEEFRSDVLSIFEYVIKQVDNTKNSKHDAIHKKVLKTIETKYYEKDLSVESIADLLGITPAYLGRLFNKMASVSLTTYITNYRMEKATDFLINTDLQINEIAEKSGFSTIGYFYNVFKKTFGVTPSQFRKTKRDSDNDN